MNFYSNLLFVILNVIRLVIKSSEDLVFIKLSLTHPSRT